MIQPAFEIGVLQKGQRMMSGTRQSERSHLTEASEREIEEGLAHIMVSLPLFLPLFHVDEAPFVYQAHAPSPRWDAGPTREPVTNGL